MMLRNNAIIAMKTASMNVRNSKSRSRMLSSLVEVEIEKNYAVIKMNRKPVNALNIELLQSLDEKIKELENNGKCRGLILTSSLPKIFSAGLDITEMHRPKPDRLKTFWKSVQDIYLRLYMTRLATIAAIDGNSPAGGCLLSMCCDYRLMTSGKNYRIGLNETKLGIVAPFWFIDTLINTVGHREAEKMLMLGKMLTAEEAKEVNLIDETVNETDILLKAKKVMNEWLSIPDMARYLTKQQLRKSTSERLRKNQEADLKSFTDFCSADAVQKSLDSYVQALSSKTSK